MKDTINPPYSEIQVIPPKPGACLVCGAYHPRELPHNRDSIYYQILFRQKHGRYPTWDDAANHCTDEIKERFFKTLLSKLPLKGGKNEELDK